MQVLVHRASERLEGVKHGGNGAEVAAALRSGQDGDHPRQQVGKVPPELVVQRGGEFLAQAKHLPQQLVGTPERVYDVQYVVEVPANVAADDGDERGELREHKLP